MRAIIIGAGRGSRLKPLTDDSHKTLTEIKGKRIIDWILNALYEGGVDDVVYIEGFNGKVIRQAFPEFTYVKNENWQNNNIMESLMCAEPFMDEPFISSYCDILYTPTIVEKLRQSPADIALGVDTDWVEHYRYRSKHPPKDAEKLTVQEGLVKRINRGLDPSICYGEFIGVAKFNIAGARLLKSHYHRCKKRFSGRPFRESPVFENSMLIHLLDEMLDKGVSMVNADTHGNYREIDTHQDLELAEKYWKYSANKFNDD